MSTLHTNMPARAKNWRLALGLGGATMAAMALGATPAHSQSTTVMGLEMGQPASLPTCLRKRLSSGEFSDFLYERNPSQTCHEPDRPVRGAPWRRGSIVFPEGKSPLIMKGSTGFTLVVDGKVEGLDFDTPNHNYSDTIIRELSLKFGKPTSVTTEKTVISGIAVPSTEAIWRSPSLLVQYSSIANSMETGRVLIETPIMERIRSQHEQERMEARAPL